MIAFVAIFGVTLLLHSARADVFCTGETVLEPLATSSSCINADREYHDQDDYSPVNFLFDANDGRCGSDTAICVTSKCVARLAHLLPESFFF